MRLKNQNTKPRFNINFALLLLLWFNKNSYYLWRKYFVFLNSNFVFKKTLSQSFITGS